MKNTPLTKQNKELFYSGPSVKNYNFIFNWLKFENEKIYIHSGKIDIGQHISTSLAIICSENLNVDLEKINILNLKSGVSPDEGFTAGSLSLSHSGSAIKAAAITFQNNFVDYICSNLNIKIDEFDIETNFCCIVLPFLISLSESFLIFLPGGWSVPFVFVLIYFFFEV